MQEKRRFRVETGELLQAVSLEDVTAYRVKADLDPLGLAGGDAEAAIGHRKNVQVVVVIRFEAAQAKSFWSSITCRLELGDREDCFGLVSGDNAHRDQ